VNIDGIIANRNPSKKSGVIDCSIATMGRLDFNNYLMIVTKVF